MKTKAAVLYRLNTPIEIVELEIPKLKKGQVLVKIVASGICRAQYNETIGLKGEDKYLPHLLGHEASGEVVDIGAGVTKVKKRDFVVCSWIKGKGLDGGAVQYKKDGQIIHAGTIATFSDFAIISENRLTKISKRVPPGVASILGCAVATGVGIVNHTLSGKKGDSIAIFGVGGIGSSVVLGAKMKGFYPIIVIDISDDKLSFAKKLGATHTINAQKEDVVNAIKKIQEEGVNFAVEASGVNDAMERAYESLAPHGQLVIAGNLRKGQKIAIDPFKLIEGRKIVGTWGGETLPDIDIPFYAQQYINGKLDLKKLITRKFKLEEVNDTLAILGRNESLGRMIIEL